MTGEATAPDEPAGSDEPAARDEPAGSHDEPSGSRDEPAAGSEEDNPSLLRTELPFGPFLAMAALFYLFAEPWIQLHFHLPGG